MIPSFIHQIWLENVNPPARSDIPDILKQLSATVGAVMPDWNHTIWTEKKLPAMPALVRAIVDGEYSAVAKSNILRYFLTYELGGFYVDMDVEIVKSFKPLRDDDFVCGLESKKHGTVSDAVFGCSVKNTVMKTILDVAVKNVLSGKVSTVDELLGSISTGMLTVEVQRAGITPLPQECFAPLDCDNKRNFRKIKPTLKNTYCIHHYLGKWAGRNGRVRF